MEDAARLLARVQQRDVAAFEALYECFRRLVYGIAVRMLNDASGAEDVTQGVFLTVWRRPESFRGGNAAAWLTRITRNRCLDILRARSTHSQSEIPIDAPAEDSLDDVVFARLDGDRVRAALARLPEDQRRAIVMGFFDGVTHEEIARRTAIPLGTIKTRIRTGLRKLREELQGAAAR